MSQSGIEALAAAQRELARLATALEGLDQALEAGGDPDAVGLATWLRADRGASAIERVAVYTHAYFSRIHGALREDYDALHAALGDDAFHDLAKLYLMAHPPNSFSLRFAGERLPGFIAGSVAEAFSSRWPFAADLAALEWALVDAFDAADSPVLARESLAAIPPEDWGGLCFSLAASTRILALAWPVQRLIAALGSAEPSPALEPAQTSVLVYRRDDRVFHRALSTLEAAALAEVVAGADFAGVCARVEAETSDGQAAVVAVSLLERWLADGLLSGLRG